MCALRHPLTLWATTLLALAAACASLLWPVQARADALAYLVNVTVRPGYNFADADQALAYGHSLCDKVAVGEDYGNIIGDVKGDLNADHEYQAAYLINQAVNELCPQLIWELRNSAAHYRSAAP
jgi:Protein of unknown function (DUF732)